MLIRILTRSVALVIENRQKRASLVKQTTLYRTDNHTYKAVYLVFHILSHDLQFS